MRNARVRARPREGAGELGEDRQVGVQPDPIQSTDAERGERPIVLEAAELALDGGAAAVKSREAGRLTRDQRVKAACLDPDRCGLALAGRAAPLARAALGVHPAKRHSPCSHVGGLCSPRRTA